MAINEEIAREVLRAASRGQEPTEVFMSTLTCHHLAEEKYRRVQENYHNPNHTTMRGKPKAFYPSEFSRRLPTELTYGKVRLIVKLRESVPTDRFELAFKKLVKQIDYRTGREEYVAT